MQLRVVMWQNSGQWDVSQSCWMRHPRRLFYLFLLHHTARGILVPWPGIEAVPPALQTRSLNCKLPRKSQEGFLNGGKIADMDPFLPFPISSWFLAGMQNMTTGAPFSHLRPPVLRMKTTVWEWWYRKIEGPWALLTMELLWTLYLWTFFTQEKSKISILSLVSIISC